MFSEELEPTVDGLVALGGGYTPRAILEAYPKGIFPWTGEHPVPWFSPDPRMVLVPSEVRVSRSLRGAIRKGGFETRIDSCFVDVMCCCAAIPRDEQDGTWITSMVVKTWRELHQHGHAHCVETWLDGRLVGGLYGLAIGRAFFGESMFHLVPDASKIALVALCRRLAAAGYHLIDCQQETGHLKSLGAEAVERQEFLRRLAVATSLEDGWGAAMSHVPAGG